MFFEKIFFYCMAFLCFSRLGEAFAGGGKDLNSEVAGGFSPAVEGKFKEPCFSADSIVINEDNDHFFKGKPEDMTEKGLRDYISNFSGGKITHIFMCPNGQRTSYKSNVHEPIWECAPDAPHRNIWCDNCKRLYDAGIDPYSVWIDECRKQKISPWITVRMNDVHFITIPGYFRTMDYWRKHPELWRVPYKDLGKGGAWTDFAFNYAKKEVRDFQFSLIKELFERYDFDGIELDWMRFCAHLTPGKGMEESKFLTEFVGDVKRLAQCWEKKRGHPIKISVRVPATIETSKYLGMDAVEWARLGYVDLIVPSCFFQTADFDIPSGEWRKSVADSGGRAQVAPATDNGVCAYPGKARSPLDWALLNGWAFNSYARGAEFLYIFNLPYNPKLLALVAKNGLSREDVAGRSRRHPITYRDFLECKSRQDKKIALPKYSPCQFDVFVGDRAPMNASVGVVLGFDKENAEENLPNVVLNGRKAVSAQRAELPLVNYGSSKSAVRFVFPTDSLAAGLNRISVESDTPEKIVWVEIFVDAG